MFFISPLANPDRFDHVHITSKRNVMELAWEDASAGGDRDFDDVVLRIHAASRLTRPRRR